MSLFAIRLKTHSHFRRHGLSSITRITSRFSSGFVLSIGSTARFYAAANTTTLPKECTESGNPVVCEAIRPIVNPSANAANNRLSSTGWQYDAAGNTIVDAKGRQFIYDAENKQIKVKDPQNQTIGEYFYNGDGLRIKKVVPGTGETTIFAYDASNRLVAEYSTVVEPTATAKTSYLTTDHLGSPRITTDQFGQVASRRDFMPYGEEIARSNYGADSIRQKFTGYERDNESSLDFAQARYYARNQGRFYSADLPFVEQRSALPQTWNLYVYCGNNPVLFTDPTGRWHWVDPDMNGRRFIRWDEDDNWETLQDFLIEQTGRYYAYEYLESVFGSGGLGAGTIVDISGLLGGVPTTGHALQDASDDFIPLGKVGKPATGLFPLIKQGVKWIGSRVKKKGAKQTTKGTLSGAVDQLNSVERAMAEELVEQGKTVIVVPRATHKTADFVIDGVETELKTLTTAGLNTMKNSIEKAAEQGKGILIDARNVGYTADDALQHIIRAEGNLGTSLKGRVTVLTKEGPVVY